MRAGKYLACGVLIGLALAAAGAPRGWKVDPVHSGVLFRVDHLGLNHVYGRFTKFDGEVILDEANPAGSSVKVSVEAASIDTAVEMRDNELRSDHYFNVAQFPTIEFQSTKVEQAGDGTYKVTGNLTLLGVTREVVAEAKRGGPMTDARGTRRIGFETTFTIRRSEFGMSRGVGMVSDEVELTVALQAVAQ